ncbi:hypothetical protein [Burkholderia pseudomallei]|uniref:hypothetical protein n=1 Tax=Burkholderia pseudomallei TaxID=28450 RepID=UPI0015C2F8AD|nr:hypothetical protein [Burkholderia pseudomallei]
MIKVEMLGDSLSGSCKYATIGQFARRERTRVRAPHAPTPEETRPFPESGSLDLD